MVQQMKSCLHNSCVHKSILWHNRSINLVGDVFTSMFSWSINANLNTTLGPNPNVDIMVSENKGAWQTMFIDPTKSVGFWSGYQRYK
jgi:hypothetical protein